MSGVKRNRLADIAEKGISGEEALKIALGPDAMRSEKGSNSEEKAEDTN